MNKLFGAHKSGHEENPYAQSPSEQPRESTEQPPDETTHLLPHSIDSNSTNNSLPANHGYLSPDDPAVSPYNLFSVRFTHYITVFLLAVTVFWWVVLLVSIFVTPPGFLSPGSPFYALGYTSIALVSLGLSLLFFVAPSKFGRIITAGIAFVLLLNIILVTAVERTRHEEGWVGISSVVWSFVMSSWTILADYTVQWGKSEEEERLTGRAESRRTLTEWVQVTVESIALIVLSAASILLFCSVILRALDAGLAPPGKRYWVDDHKYEIHVYCRGLKSKEHLPTVLFEGGEDTVENGIWQFAENAVKNGSINRYCFADRPGLAWSDAGPSPLSAGMAIEALSEALASAGEMGPWVLVGAGVGSLYSRVFSSRHGAEVEGLLLVDPLHEDLLYRLGKSGRGFLLWVRGMLSPLGLGRVPGALFKGRNKEDRVWGRAAYQSSKTIFAKLQENLVANSLTRRDVVTSRAIQYRDTMLAVVSSGKQIRQDGAWQSKQEDLTHLTNNLLAWDVVDDAPHQVWKTLEGRNTIEQRLEAMVHQHQKAEAVQGEISK